MNNNKGFKLLTSPRQPGVVSQIVEAYASGEMANDAFYLIGSAVLQCMECH
jgi:hypothetical protein